MKTVLLVLAVLLVVAGYGAAYWWWPYTACRRCEGSGKHRSPSGFAWRRCRRCHGTGTRIRLGRRVLNVLIPSLRKET
jgi:DnaJ-class molecular chaperone